MIIDFDDFVGFMGVFNPTLYYHYTIKTSQIKSSSKQYTQHYTHTLLMHLLKIIQSAMLITCSVDGLSMRMWVKCGKVTHNSATCVLRVIKVYY
jgi:hypothetical protein